MPNFHWFACFFLILTLFVLSWNFHPSKPWFPPQNNLFSLQFQSILSYVIENHLDFWRRATGSFLWVNYSLKAKSQISLLFHYIILNSIVSLIRSMFSSSLNYLLFLLKVAVPAWFFRLCSTWAYFSLLIQISSFIILFAFVPDFKHLALFVCFLSLFLCISFPKNCSPHFFVYKSSIFLSFSSISQSILTLVLLINLPIFISIFRVFVLESLFYPVIIQSDNAFLNSVPLKSFPWIPFPVIFLAFHSNHFPFCW